MKIFILIPAYNCEKLLPKVIERILKLNLDLKIIILDDGSKDKTLEVAKKYESDQVLIFTNNINCGYGAVSKKLYEIVKPMKPDFTISMHADLGHIPEDIIKFTNIINEKRIHFDLVLGSRLLYLKKIIYSKNFFKIFNNNERGNMPLIIVLGQLIVTFLQNIILSTKLNSFHDGMRMCSLNTINWILSKNFSKIAGEAKSVQERMSALYEDMGHILSRYYEVNEKTENTIDEGDYEAFFQSTMKKFGISSPDELDDDKKKEFFNYVDANYKAEKETD